MMDEFIAAFFQGVFIAIAMMPLVISLHTDLEARNDTHEKDNLDSH